MPRLVLILACVLAGVTAPIRGQATSSDEAVSLLLGTLEQALQANDRAVYGGLFDASMEPARVETFAQDLFVPGAIQTTVRERDRTALEGAPEGDGHRLVVEFFIETAGRARILTMGIDIRRPPDGAADSWRIVGAEGLTSVDGLYRLRVNPEQQLTARNLTVTSEDLVVTLPQGTAFLVDGEAGVTGLVLIGRGDMRFSPTPPTEQGQLRIFAGSEAMVAPFDTAFVRFSPSEYEDRVSTGGLTPGPVNQRLLQRAEEVFAREGPKSLSLDLNDLSSDTWYLLPPPGDFIAEVQTRRFGSLTYARTGIQAEDVTLFSRERRRTIALYPSKDKLAARGRFYTEDDLLEYDVLDYSIEAAVEPQNEYVQGRARLALRIRDNGTNTLTLRLAESLEVSSIVSLEYGRLLHLRVRNQNTIIVNLPTTLVRDTDLTLVLTYAGRVPAQGVDREALQFGGQDDFSFAPEPNYLLSNRSYWYPQNPIGDYATATLRITVPRGFTAVASGQEYTTANAEVSLRELLTMPSGRTFVFRASEPLRYLAFVVSRFTRVAQSTVVVTETDEQPRLDRQRNSVTLTVDANPRHVGRGRGMLDSIEQIMRFYATVMGDAPYASATVALVESDLPGGHSPGYFAVVNHPLSSTSSTWRNDPAAFDGFPDFFVAHELAHQWWGQAVGWTNYHEQWISEGFAQYFAALYAREARGEATFLDMLRQFRRWALAESDEGPVYLGYRLGHIKNDGRIFRALVYNKGASVLHMLRRLVGDEAFFAGLRTFYEEQKYQKAGTDDLRRVLEKTSGQPLERFFERWIYESGIPTVRYRTGTENGHVVVRFEQLGDLVYDLPVTVTVTMTTGQTAEFVVPLTEAVVEHRIALDAPVRQIQVNRDNAALAVFEDR